MIGRLFRTAAAAGIFALVVYSVLWIYCPASIKRGAPIRPQASEMGLSDTGLASAAVSSVSAREGSEIHAQHQSSALASVDNPREARIQELNRLLKDSSASAAEVRRSKVREWADVDASAAAGWAATISDSAARADSLEQVAIAWSESDLQAAARWASSLPEDHAKETAVLALAYESARADPITALRAASELPPTTERDQAVAHAVSQWASSDAAAALEWSSQVIDPQLRQLLLSDIAIASSESEPSTAATLTASLLESGPQQANAACSVVQRWAQSSPQAAADWVVQFPDSAVREAAMDNLVTIWAMHDSAAAQKWAQGLPEGALRDAALAAYQKTTAVLPQTTY